MSTSSREHGDARMMPRLDENGLQLVRDHQFAYLLQFDECP